MTVTNDPCQETGPGGTAVLRDDLFYFPDIVWYGGPHDGYCRSTTISAYVWIRLPTCARSRKEHVALFQSALTFGVLEAITGLSIPESQLLSRRSDG